MSGALRIVEVLLWLGLFSVTIRPTFRLMFGLPLRLDMLWFGVCLGTVNRVLFNLVNTYLSDSVIARDLCHLYALVVAAIMVAAVIGVRRHERN